MNPHQNVPTLVDGDFVLNESRAIIAYLANAYGSKSNVYPADPKIRGVVDQRLYWDMGTFFKAFADCAVSFCFYVYIFTNFNRFIFSVPRCIFGDNSLTNCFSKIKICFGNGG